MNFKVKGFSYIGFSTTDNITLYKDTTIDKNLTTGNTTINEYLTVTCNLTYNGDSSSGSSRGILDAHRLTLNKPSNDSETPLKTITTKTVKLLLWKAL